MKCVLQSEWGCVRGSWLGPGESFLIIKSRGLGRQAEGASPFHMQSQSSFQLVLNTLGTTLESKGE